VQLTTKHFSYLWRLPLLVQQRTCYCVLNLPFTCLTAMYLQAVMDINVVFLLLSFMRRVQLWKCQLRKMSISSITVTVCWQQQRLSKVHNIVFLPCLRTAVQVNFQLNKLLTIRTNWQFWNRILYFLHSLGFHFSRNPRTSHGLEETVKNWRSARKTINLPLECSVHCTAYWHTQFRP